jgi:MFS family permease
MSERDGGFRGWLSVAGAGIAFFVQGGAAIYSFGVFLPWLCRECNWTRGDVSVALSICMMLGTLSAPAAGFLVARFGPGKAIVAGNLLIALALLGLAFQSALWQFYAAYAVAGVGTGLAGIIPAGTLASNWFVRKAPLAMSVVTGSGGVGGLVLVPVVTALINGIGWRHAYLVLFALMLVFGALVPVLIVKNRPEHSETLRESGQGAVSGEEPRAERAAAQPQASPDVPLSGALRTPTFWLLTIWSCTALFVFMFFTAHQIAYLTGLGLSSEMAAMALGIASGATVVGTIAIGVLSLKFSLRGLAIVASGTVMVATILAFTIRSVPLAFVFSILFGVGFGAGLVCFMGLLPAYFGRKHFSKIFGVSVLFGIAGTLGAPVGGFLFDATGSYVLPLTITAVVAALGLVCIIAAREPASAVAKTEFGGDRVVA